MGDRWAFAVTTRWVAFALVGLMVLAGAGCGGDTTSSSDGGAVTTVDSSSDGGAAPTDACLKAMTDFAGSYDLSDPEQQTFANATFDACGSAAAWNAAAEQHRSYTLDGPYVLGGNASADDVRHAFCQGIGEVAAPDPVPPACSDQ